MTHIKEELSVIAAQNHWDIRILERDYHIIRFLSQVPAWDNRLGLKGSLALTKVYLNSYRLCKDVDFWFIGKPLTGRSQRLKILEDLVIKLNPLLQALNLTGQCRILANARLLRVEISYHSLFTTSVETFKVEIILFTNPVQAPTVAEVKHFYEGIGSFKLPTISLQEAVVEKLKGALDKDRRCFADRRDVYDLWRISQNGFNFKDERFIQLLKHQLIEDGARITQKGWHLNAVDDSRFSTQMQESLRPFISQNEVFDYPAALLALNKKLSNPAFGLTIFQYSRLMFNRYRRTIEDLLEL